MGNVDELLDGAVSSGQVSGAVGIATVQGCPSYLGAFGLRASASWGRMSGDTLFQADGLLRPVLAVAALQLVDSCVVGLDQPLRTVIPGLAAPRVLTGFTSEGTPLLRPARGEITLRRVLSHTAGLADGSWWRASADLFTPHGTLPAGAPGLALLADPGTRWLHYSDVDLVRLVIERLSGMTVVEYLEDEIFRELGMVDTGFDSGQRSRPWGRPEAAGVGGFCTTPRDYLEFVEAVLFQDQSVLSPESFALLCTNQIGALTVPATVSLTQARTPADLNFYPEIRLRSTMTGKWSLGFLVNLDGVPGGPEAGTLTCAGDANTYCWVDPAAGVAGLLFTQARPGRSEASEVLFARFQRAVYANRRTHREGDADGTTDDWPSDTLPN